MVSPGRGREVRGLHTGLEEGDHGTHAYEARSQITHYRGEPKEGVYPEFLQPGNDKGYRAKRQLCPETERFSRKQTTARCLVL